MKTITLFLILLLSPMVSQAQNTSKHAKAAQKHQNNLNFEKAVKLYSKSIKKNNKDYFSIGNRGMCYYALNQHQKSLDDLLVIDKFQPHDPITNYYIGLNYFGLSQYNKAVKWMTLALENDIETNASFYYDLGTVHYFSGNNEQAIKYLNRCLKLDPNHAGANNNLAWAYIDTNPEKSCTLFKIAYDLDSTDAINVNNLGYAELLSGNLEAGKAYIDKAQIIDPNNPFVYRNYGLYYMYKSDPTNACIQLKKAISLGIVDKYGLKYIETLQTYCSSN